MQVVADRNGQIVVNEVSVGAGHTAQKVQRLTSSTGGGRRLPGAGNATEQCKQCSFSPSPRYHGYCARFLPAVQVQEHTRGRQRWRGGGGSYAQIPHALFYVGVSVNDTHDTRMICRNPQRWSGVREMVKANPLLHNNTANHTSVRNTAAVQL